MSAKPQIKLVQVGQTLMLKVPNDRAQHNFTSPDKEKREMVKKMVEAYNKLPSETKLMKILKIVDEKKLALEVKQMKEKKKIKKDVKVTKRALGETKKLLAEAAVGIRGFLKGDKRFITVNGCVYLAPFETVPMPISLVNTLADMIQKNENVDALINFWKLCLLNPNPIARNKLFGYLQRHKLVITPAGYLVTYRNVKKTDTEGVFTSAHTGKEQYRIGKVFRMDRKACDEDGANDCSRGLHTGTPEFLGIHGLDKIGDGYVDKGKVEILSKSNGGGQGTGYYEPAEIEKLKRQTFTTSFGNQAVICLVNPMHVVSVPESDTRKMRSCELYFVKTTTPEEVVDIQVSEYHTYENAYKAYEKEELEKMLEETKLIHHVKSAPESDVTQMSARKKAVYEERLKELQAKMKIGQDTINKELSFAEINAIIQSRVS
jgi:hypothetical protein